jgi:hypothetical protein
MNGSGHEDGKYGDCKMEDKDLIEFLQQNVDSAWKDLHHSRNQDWKYWAAFAAIVAGLFQTTGNDLSRLLLLAIGTMVSASAAIVSWNHWDLHRKKLTYIEWLHDMARILIEKTHPEVSAKICYHHFDTRERMNHFRVSGVLFALYLVLSLGAMLCFILISLSPTISIKDILTDTPCAALTRILALIGVMLIWYYVYRHAKYIMDLKKKSYRDHFFPKKT